MKKVYKILYWLLTAFVSLIVLLYIFSRIFEDKIVKYAVDELNKNISVPIQVDEIKLTFIRNFPRASVDFKNVLIANANSNNSKIQDSIFFVSRFSVGSDLKSLLNKQFTINYIELDNAIIKYLVDAQGKSNWEFLELLSNKKRKKDTVNVDLLLKKLKFKNVSIEYNNEYKQRSASFYIPEFTANGKLHSDKYQVTTKGNINIIEVTSGKIKFAPKSNTTLDLSLSVNQDTLIIDGSNLSTKGLLVHAKGKIILSDETLLDIKLSANSVQLKQIYDLLPEDFIHEYKDVSIDGQANLNTSIKGIISNSRSPLITTSFSIDSAQLVYDNHLKINNITCSGQYTNGTERSNVSSKIELSSLYISTDSSNLYTSFSIVNFSKPEFKFTSEYKIDASDLTFISNDEFKILNGTVSGIISSQGKIINSIDKDFLKLILTNSESNIDVKNISISLPKASIEIINTDAHIIQSYTNYNIQKMNGVFNGISFNSSNIYLFNLYESVIAKLGAVLTVKGDIELGSVVYKDIEQLFKTEQLESANDYKLKYQILSSFHCKSFVIDNILFENIKGNCEIDNSSITGKPLFFKAFDGSTNLNFRYVFNNNADKLEFNMVSREIDISKLFVAMNDFDQKDLTSKNIRGIADNSCNGSLLIKNGKVQTSSIDLLGSITINKGELIDYKPIQKLSSFTNISELSHIKFETLSTSYLVTNEIVHISNTDIKSNSMDVTLEGFQKFNGDYQYNLRLYLSDILRGKTKQIQEKQSKYGIVLNNGSKKTSLFLVTSSINGKTSTKIDKDQLKVHLKGEVSKEKKEFKHALNKEFGWFKKDTADFKELEKEQEPQFEIEWDE